MTINSFTGKYRWLSNFTYVKVLLDGQEFPSVENAYQAAKYIEKNKEYRYPFTLCTPSEAKKLGKVIPLSDDWGDRKLIVMYNLLKQKFRPGSYFASLLVETGHEDIIEGNYWGDTFWGIYRGRGENHLGKLIMDIRSDLSMRKLNNE